MIATLRIDNDRDGRPRIAITVVDSGACNFERITANGEFNGDGDVDTGYAAELQRIVDA